MKLKVISRWVRVFAKFGVISAIAATAITMTPVVLTLLDSRGTRILGSLIHL